MLDILRVNPAHFLLGYKTSRQDHTRKSRAYMYKINPSCLGIFCFGPAGKSRFPISETDHRHVQLLTWLDLILLRSFCNFSDLHFVSVPQNVIKKRSRYPAFFTVQVWSITRANIFWSISLRKPTTWVLVLEGYLQKVSLPTRTFIINNSIPAPRRKNNGKNL